MPQRYELTKQSEGTWEVTDRFTGLPAVYDDETLSGLDLDDADDLVDLLNTLDRKRRGEP